MSLVEIEEVRDLVQTPLSDAALQTIIDREEADVIKLHGPHYSGTSGTISEVHRTPPGSGVFLRRPILSVSSVSEKTLLTDSTARTLTANTDYYVWSEEGWIERLSGSWGAVITVVYVPQDDSDKRKSAIIDLARLAVERTAMKSESVAGEYSYQAPDWDAERSRILRRIGFMETI